jgi:hypothetical protein
MKGVELNNECEKVITNFWTDEINDTRVTFTSKKVKRLVNAFFCRLFLYTVVEYLTHNPMI